MQNFKFFYFRRSVRSGYAFAHQEGFGRLITSGRIMSQNQQGGNPAFRPFHASILPVLSRARTTSQSKQKSTTTPVKEEDIPQDNFSRGSGAPAASGDSNKNQTVQFSINGQSREVPLPNQVSN